MFKPKLPQQEQGFTLVEVLVAILITTVFISVAMQGIVIAAIFRAKAQENAEATTWIQEGLEGSVKPKADSLQFPQTTLAKATATSLAVDAAAAASSITVNGDIFEINDTLKVGLDSTNYTVTAKSGSGITSTLTITPNLTTPQAIDAAVVATSSITVNGDIFEINDTLKVGLDPINYKVTAKSGSGSNSTLTITPNLTTTQAIDATVVATKMCNPAARNAGLADKLRDEVIAEQGVAASSDNSTLVSVSKNFRTGKAFIKSRTTTLSATFPYSVLEVSYSVAPQSAHTTLSTAASATSTTLSVNSASGFKLGDKLTVGTNTDNTIQSISGNTIRLTNQLGSAQPSDSIVDASIATLNTEVIPNVAFQCP